MQRICIYCGSSQGDSPAYAGMAEKVAEVLVAANKGLVYGGGAVGLMGVLADKMLALGGEVVGVIPRALAVQEVAHPRLTEMHVVDSMHTRKALMADLAGAFIALPGGFGTLDELFETLTWGQLGLHRKPCGLLNVAGYFDALIAFADRMVASRFVKPVHRSLLLVDTDPAALLRRLEAHRAPIVKKWLTPDES